MASAHPHPPVTKPLHRGVAASRSSRLTAAGPLVAVSPCRHPRPPTFRKQQPAAVYPSCLLFPMPACLGKGVDSSMGADACSNSPDRDWFACHMPPAGRCTPPNASRTGAARRGKCPRDYFTSCRWLAGWAGPSTRSYTREQLIAPMGCLLCEVLFP